MMLGNSKMKIRCNYQRHPEKRDAAFAKAKELGYNG
jgi:hypothetical protein